MTEGEVADLVSFLSENPRAGDEMAGTGGCRKLRFARRGAGKSGGYRAITFLTGLEMPVFLITVFAKGEKANLTKAEQNKLGVIAKEIAATYRTGSKQQGASQ